MTEQTDVLTFLAQLEEERDRLDVMIGEMRRRLGLGPAAEIPGSAPPGISGQARESVVTGRIRPDEFFRLSTPEAIRKFLEIMKRPQGPKAIVEGLHAGGVLTNAKNFYANVNKELQRMQARGEVANTPSGWGLAEWYPAKPKAPDNGKKTKKRKAKAQQQSKMARSQKPEAAPASGYRAFVAQQRKEGKTMAEAAAAWQAQKPTAE